MEVQASKRSFVFQSQPTIRAERAIHGRYPFMSNSLQTPRMYSIDLCTKMFGRSYPLHMSFQPAYTVAQVAFWLSQDVEAAGYLRLIKRKHVRQRAF